MDTQNAGGWQPFDRSTLLKRVRKVAIVLLLLCSLWPVVAVNVALNAQQAGWPEPLRRLNSFFPAFDALLLSQQWSLFTYIPPFNYRLNFEVNLTDGRTVLLRDLDKEHAGKWESILFHNEPKTENNLYANRNGLHQYMEYLIRTNGLNPFEVARRTIFIRYRNLLRRDEAAVAGTYYGPETQYVVESY